MFFDTPTAEEWSFVFDSWARSFRKSPWAGVIPNHLYDTVSREAAKQIVDRPGVHVVAVFPNEETRRIMGYAVAQPDRNILHWLYVKSDFRGMGVGAALLNYLTPAFPGPLPFTYTFRTRASEGFLGREWQWNPVPARVK